jgi:hypothetical protein
VREQVNVIQAHSNAGAVLTQKRMAGDAKIAHLFLRYGLPEVISFWRVGYPAFFCSTNWICRLLA